MELEHIRIKPVWPKSKEETWDELFEHLDERIVTKRLFSRVPFWAYAAAVVVVLFLTGAFYTKTERTERGQHAVVQLPDRSTVTLNAESRLSYKPCIWLIARKVRLEGEAFFEVKQGSRFSVQSGHNQVNVLGTAFNVYTRIGTYRVTCLSGQVEVHAGGEFAVLNPHMQAVFNEQQLSLTDDVSPAAATGWIQGMFVFEETPLKEVIAEVERQYNIQVASDYDPNHFYTGNFSKTDKAEELLEIIGKPFGITFSIK